MFKSFAAVLSLMMVASQADAADQPAQFAPPVGSTLEYHVTQSISQNSGPEMRVDVTQIRTVAANDGLTAKLSFDVKNFATIQSNPSATPVNSPDDYLIYRLYQLEENSNVSKKAADGSILRFRTRYNCDKAALQSFLPIGRVPSIQVPCTLSRSFDGKDAPDFQYVETVSYEGTSKQSTPAGNFTVENIRTTFGQDGDQSDTLVLFDTTRGVIVKSISTINGPKMHIQTVSELVKLR